MLLGRARDRPPSGASEPMYISPFFKQERLNSKKQKTKDDKKVVKSVSRDRLLSEDPAPDSAAPSQEPIDPLVMEKYTQRLHAEVKGRGQAIPHSPHTCILHSPTLHPCFYRE